MFVCDRLDSLGLVPVLDPALASKRGIFAEQHMVGLLNGLLRLGDDLDVTTKYLPKGGLAKPW